MRSDPPKPPLARCYAFWSYSGFPGVLGGRVKLLREDGCICTVEYGPGHWFTPVLILPEKPGLALLARLKTLSEEHAAAEKEFRDAWEEKSKLMLYAARKAAETQPADPGTTPEKGRE